MSSTIMTTASLELQQKRMMKWRTLRCVPPRFWRLPRDSSVVTAVLCCSFAHAQALALQLLDRCVSSADAEGSSELPSEMLASDEMTGFGSEMPKIGAQAIVLRAEEKAKEFEATTGFTAARGLGPAGNARRMAELLALAKSAPTTEAAVRASGVLGALLESNGL